MSFSSHVYSAFHKLSKRFSRYGLYQGLQDQISFLNNRKQQIKVLNIGSGGDVYERLRMLKQADVVQIDIDPDRKPDIVADVCDLNMIETSSIDTVFMLEVLEHVKTPQEALNEIHRVLKPGGQLCLTTPFIFPLHDEPYDFYRYTKYGLTHLLRNFSDIKITERNDYLHAIMVLFARTIITSNKRNRLTGLVIFSAALLFYPLIWILSKLYVSTKATTGYISIAVK